MSAILFSVLLILTLLADSASTGVLLVLVAIATGAAAIAAMTGHRTSNGQKKSRPVLAIPKRRKWEQGTVIPSLILRGVEEKCKMKIPDNVLIIYDAPMESCCAYQFETGGYKVYISKHDDAYEVIRKALEYIEACEAAAGRERSV